jgi:hypothetical protein
MQEQRMPNSSVTIMTQSRTKRPATTLAGAIGSIFTPMSLTCHYHQKEFHEKKTPHKLNVKQVKESQIVLRSPNNEDWCNPQCATLSNCGCGPFPGTYKRLALLLSAS